MAKFIELNFDSDGAVAVNVDAIAYIKGDGNKSRVYFLAGQGSHQNYLVGRDCHDSKEIILRRISEKYS